MTSNDEYVIQLLTERGYITPDQVEAAAVSMKAENETTLDVLVSGGALSEDEVLGTIADQFGLKYCHVNADAIDQGVTNEIPEEIARKYGVVPIVASEESITVALSDPMGYDAIDSLRYVLHGKDIEAVLCPLGEVKSAMAKLYQAGEAADVATRDDIGGTNARAAGLTVDISTGIHDGHSGSVPISQALNAFNILADEENKFSSEEIAFMEKEEKIFPGLEYNDIDDAFDSAHPVLLRRQSASARMTLFEGGHNIFPATAFEWLSRQVRGKAADWSKGHAVDAENGELSK